MTGHAKMDVQPDLVCLTVNAETLNDTYAEAYEQGRSDAATISRIAEEAGIDKIKVRTKDFEIEKSTVSDRDENGNYTGTRLIGYSMRQTTVLTMPIDRHNLHRLIEAIGRQMPHTEFEIDYAIADPVPAEQELARRAVRDARTKAEIIAEALGVRLGRIVSIDYSVKRIDVYSHSSRSLGCCTGSIDGSLDITPDDIHGEDHATVVWQIIQ